MVCQGECFNKSFGLSSDLTSKEKLKPLVLLIKLTVYCGKVGWRLANKLNNVAQPIKKKKTERKKDSSFKELLNDINEYAYGHYNLEQETESLKHVKKLLDAYPLDLD